nr:hypothetical protein [uncultured Desulfobacter sp.]
MLVDFKSSMSLSQNPVLMVFMLPKAISEQHSIAKELRIIHDKGADIFPIHLVDKSHIEHFILLKKGICLTRRMINEAL